MLITYANMRRTLVSAAIIAIATLAACGNDADRNTKSALEPARPAVVGPTSPPATLRTPAPSGPDSTPKAADVLSSDASGARADPATGPQSGLSKADESEKMPKPGQNNDHSTQGAGTATAKP